MASLIDTFNKFKQKVASINVFAPKKFVSPVPEKQYTPPTPQPKISFQDNVRQFMAKPIPKPLQSVANLAGRAATSPLAKTITTPIKGLASRYQPQVNFTSEAVRQAKLVLTNPTYRKVIFNPESITPDELDSIKDIPEAKFVKPEQIKSRGKIALTGGAAGIQSALTTKGLGHSSAAVTAGISGMLAYGLAKLSGSKDAFSDALLAVGRSPTYAGINSLTGGLQGNIANQVAGKGANFLTRGLAKGLIFGTGNVIEDVAFTPILEGRPPTKQELAISGGVGLLGSVGSEALGAAFNNIKRIYSQLHPELPDTAVTKASQDFIRNELGQFITGKKFEPVGSSGGKKVDLVSVSDARMIRKGLGLPENGLTVEDLPGGLQAKPIGGTDAIMQAESTKGLKIPKAGSGEQIIEQAGGWKPGMKAQFDMAMAINKDPDEVRRLLPEVPAYYKEKFSTEISNLLNAKQPTIEFPTRQSAPNRLETPSTSSNSKAGSSADSIPKPSKMSIDGTSSEYNVGRIKVKDDKLIRQAVEEVAPEFKKVVGDSITHKEIVKNANEFSEDMIKVIGRAKTVELGEAQLRLRQNIAALADQEKVTPELLEKLKTDAAFARSNAQLLGQRNIDAAPKTPAGKLKLGYLKAVAKVSEDMDDILKKAEGVDFSDKRQADAFYREFIKPSVGDWADKIRYSSMLSSPNTHIINISSNLQGTGILTPIQKTIEGGIDSVVSTLTGAPRTRFAGEGPAYAKGYFGSVKQAYKNMLDVFSDKTLYENPDFRRISLTQKGPAKGLENVLDVPGKALEAMDQFFKTLTKGGLESSTGYRAGKGVSSSADLDSEAEKLLFRGDLTEEGGGVVTNVIGAGGEWVKRATQSDNRLFRWVAKLSLPFLNIGTNLAKAGVEGNPILGSINMIGNKDKTAQGAKLIMGGAVTAIGTMLALDDRLTFNFEGKDRDAARAAGMEPYSIKIGDKWISYDKMHPLIAFQLATVAGISDAFKKGKLSESQGQIIMQGLYDHLQFVADQSYFRNIGDFVGSLKGDVELAARLPTNYVSQFVPFRALMSWINRMIDQYERKPDTTADWFTKSAQSIMTQIPGLSTQVPKRLDSQGQPIKRSLEDRLVGAFSPSKVRTENEQGKVSFDYFTNSLRAYKNLKKLPPEQKAGVLIKMKESNPNLFGLVKKLIKDDALKITDQEKKIRDADVANGARAQAVITQLKKAANPEEQVKLIKRYSELGILTPDTMKTVISQLKGL